MPSKNNGGGIPGFLVPPGDPERANHFPNESYRLERLWQGITTSTSLLALHAEERKIIFRSGSSERSS